MKNAWRLAVVLGLGLGLGGCASGSTTAGSALVHPKFPYAVTYDDEAQKSVLGEEWRLENYRHKDRSADIERKRNYDLRYAFDLNDDDKADTHEEFPYPDLLFINRKTNARLELSTLLLGEKLADKELRVLLNDLVSSRSGTRSLLVGFGQAALGIEKRFATRLLDSAEATLDGNKGLVATIERADLDQLQLNPNARWERSRLFLMHAPFDYYVPGGNAQDASGQRDTRTFKKFRVLLVAEYTNTPEDFDAQYAAFPRLLNKVHVLDDGKLMAYLGQPLSTCKGHQARATVDVNISETGKARVVGTAGIGRTCAQAAVTAFSFASTGATRTLSTSYDFNLPQRPAWLTQLGYQEQRVAAVAPAPAAPLPAAPAAPAAAPEAPGAPTDAPAAPAAPSTAPAAATPPSAPPAASPAAP